MLDGRPVHAGTGLLLRVDGGELRVCFEVDRDYKPVLYLRLGDVVEAGDTTTFPPRLRCTPEHSTDWRRIALRWPPARRWSS